MDSDTKHIIKCFIAFVIVLSLSLFVALLLLGEL